MQTNRFSSVQSRGREIDAGLQAHMQSVYNRMAMGVFVTAMTAWFVSSVPDAMYLMLGTPLKFVVLFAPLLIVWFGFNPVTMSSSKLKLGFFAVSVLYGISFSAYAFIADAGTITRAFLITTGMFAGLSIFGYTTKKNLDGLGTFAVMGVMGVFFASLGLMIAGWMGVETSMAQNLLSGVAIVAFAGVTAWQTQIVKEMYHPAQGGEINSRMAWSAALTLYISFVALFQHILHLMNQR